MPDPSERRFVTVLFTDIVGSTDIAAELGDRRWRELVRRHHAIVRSELKRFDGREMDTAGDGFFAVFDSPGAAIRCACSIAERVRHVGLEIRAGLHGGEVELGGGKASGIAVNTAARVMSVGGSGEVLVSSSLHDVVAGSTLGFDDHGVHHLKGIGGEWRLFAVTEVDGGELPGPLDAAEAAKVRFAIEDEPPRHGRRTPLLVGGILAAVVLAAVVLLNWPRDGTFTASLPEGGTTPPSSVAKFDLRSDEITVVNRELPANPDVAFENEDLEVGEGSLWLQRGGTLVRIDPVDANGRAAEGNRGATGIEVGFGAVWLATLDGLRIVSPGTGETEDLVTFPGVTGLETGPTDIALGFDQVWLSTVKGLLLRVDPETHRADRYRLGGTLEHLASGTDAIWLTDELEGVVTRFDPVAGTVVDRIGISGGQDEIAVGEGFVWVLDRILGTLTPIGESAGDVRTAIDVGDEAEDVEVGRGSVWVASGGSVLEINPATLQIVRTIRIGPTPILELIIDPASGGLWVSLAGRP